MAPPAKAPERQASLLDETSEAGVVQSAANSKVTGEASLKIKLGAGLVPDGGVQTKGDLFKEIAMDRGAVPYATSKA